jgi:hypothetical protein
MKNLLKVITVTILTFMSFGANAQNMKITGAVYDTSGTQPLYQAMIMAVRVKDSLLLGFTRTNKSGGFTLTNFPVDTFTMVISHPRFDDKNIYIFGSADNYEIDIPTIKMPSKAKELEEVMIYANKNPIFYKGDTLVYVADSFKVAEGAVVEDLLKKLPGIKIDKDGKITSQGQEINKVLVDGDEFFGSDPTVATKNLGADGVEQVQIYEKTDNETIGGSDEKIKVLDLKLKEEAKKGYFGRVSGASDLALTPLPDDYAGTKPFYEGELLFNKFSSRQKISVFALGSNTPRSNFGRGDMNKFGLSNESGANRNFWEPDNADNNSGIPQTFKAGVYYSNKFGKKQNTELLFNYSYYNDRLDSRSESRSQYFLSDTTYSTEDLTRDKTVNESHNLNLTITSQIDSLTLIEFKPSVSLSKGTTESDYSTTFIGESGIESLSTSISNDNVSKGLQFNNTTRLYRKFKKKRRELEVRYDLNMKDNENDGSLSTVNDYKLFSFKDTVDQSRINNNSTMNHYGTVNYFEPLGKKMRVGFNYLYEYGLSEQFRESSDRINGVSNNIAIDSLSNKFDNTRMQNRFGTELWWENGKHSVMGGAYVRNINIDNHNQVTDSIINQNINNFLPKFKYEYRPSMSKRFTVSYTTSSQAPSVNDLQPVQDNSNPNRVQIGNPDLRPNYVHNVMVNFNTWNALSGKYIWSGASYVLTDDAFANKTTFDQFGRTNAMTVNVDGNMSANLWVGAGYPIFGRKIEFQPNLTAGFNRFNSFVGDLKNTTDNLTITPELDIDIELDSLEIGLKSSYSYNNPKSSLSSVSNTPFSTQNYSMDISWQLPLGFKFEIEGEYTKNSQPGDGFYDYEFFILNAEFSKKFLKTQNLMVSVKGNDILNQNINAQRTVNGNSITDFRTTIISRYYLLKVTYRFNNRRSREEDFRGMH